MLLTFFNFAQASSIDPNQLVIKMKSGKSLPKSIYIKTSRKLFENVYVVKTNNLIALEKTLKNNLEIEYTERNFKAEKRTLPLILKPQQFKLDTQSEFNDPRVGRIWSFNDALKNGVSVNSAYKSYGTAGTTPVIVAVVDTGIDTQHEDLKDNLWTNPNEIPNNGIDDDQNGYIDDVHGINTLERDSAGHATGDNTDKNYHGTHVAGTIGAKQNNNIGVAGIASNVKIMAIRTVPSEGDETDIDVAESFVYAAKNGARIINCSFGKHINEGQKLIPDTLKYIADKYGVLVVAAAGNDSQDIDQHPIYPASFPNENLLIVASTDHNGKMSSFSNYGKMNVDVAAPGGEIYSTLPGNDYGYLSGTSMATPTTVGVAAEILAHFPNLTYLQLKNILIKSVTPIDKFKNKMVSGGRVDLLNALDLARNTKQ